MTASTLPLDGITVVTLEQAVAAPLATRHLADLGARVVKLERVGEGDFARNYDGAVRGLASHFAEVTAIGMTGAPVSTASRVPPVL